MQQFLLQFYTLFRPLAEFFPTVVPSGLVRRQIGNHCAQSGTHGTHISRYRASTGCGRFTCCFVGKALHCQVGKFAIAIIGIEEVFHHFFCRIKWLEVVETHRFHCYVNNIFFRYTERAVLLAQEVFAGLNKATFGHQTHNFGACNAQTAILCAAAHFVKCHMQRGYIDVGDIHRHLCYAVFFDIPTYGFCRLQCAGYHHGIAVFVAHGFAGDGVSVALGSTLLAHVECHGIGTAGAGGIEVIIHGYQEVASAHCGATGACHAFVERTIAVIGRTLWHTKSFGQCFIFALAAHCQILAFGLECGCFVAIAWYREFFGNALGKLTRQLCALFEGDATHRHQWQHIGSSHSWVCAVMLTHIYQLSGFLHCLECGFHHCLGLAYKSNYGAIGCLAGIYVEQFYAFAMLYFFGYLTNYFFVSSFAKIWNTFNDSS